MTLPMGKRARSSSPTSEPKAKVPKLEWGKKVDGQRYVERLLRKAVVNKVVLPFRLTEFLRAKDSGSIPIAGPNFVPADDHFVLFYCPSFVTPSRAEELCERILDLVLSNPPKADSSSGDKRSRGMPPAHHDNRIDKTAISLATLPPSAYYISPAWHGTAQEYRTDPTPSKDMKTLTSEESKQQLAALQACVQEIDHQIGHLVDMISPRFGSKLQHLHKAVASENSSCRQSLHDHWTSRYMCQAIAFNRKTQLHRDSKGFCNNLEAIYLLGKFNGGHLHFPDLNLKVEWGPTDFCMFDGYTFAHEAVDWTGTGRVCCISFCRASTFKGLGVPLYMPCPKACDIPSTLRRNP